MYQLKSNHTSPRTVQVPRSVVLLAVGLLASAMAGCGSGIHDPNFNPNPPTTSTPVTNYTGNWEMTTVTATKGSSPDPLSKFTGSILSDTSAGAAADSITAVFRATAGCYADSPTVPMSGTLNGTAFNARSFAVKGQFLTLAAQLDATAAHMSGTYSIGGGCSNGEAGTFTGDRFQALTGTYTGSFTESGTAHSVSLTLVQSTSPTGTGAFFITGSGSISNFACFTSGTIPDGGATISGGDVLIKLNTSGAAIVGRLTTDAQTLTVSTLTVAGQGCAGSYTGLILKKQ